MKLLPVFAIAILATAIPAQTPYALHHTTASIEVDGVRDAAYDAAETLITVTPVDHEPTPTRAWMLWSDTHLHVFFEADDQELKGTRTERDTSVFRDDVLETFIKPEDSYFNIEINLLGTIHDGRGGVHPTQVTMEEMQIATVLNGTLNDPSDLDEGWTLEIALPFTDLDLSRPPQVGDEWAFHLARYDWSQHVPGGERQLSSTAPLTRVNFHWLPDWGTLTLVGD